MPQSIPYLHGCEVSDVVKLKDHLHVTFREALVAPAHIVVPGPHAVHVAVDKIIQTPGAVRQLAEALFQSRGRTDGRQNIQVFTFLLIEETRQN